MNAEGFNTYQYDYTADLNGLAVINGAKKAANVFTVYSDEDLMSISVCTPCSNTVVKAKIILLDGKSSEPEQGTVLATVEKKIPYAGRHMLILDNKVSLKEDSFFSIVVEIYSEDQEKNMVCVNQSFSKEYAEKTKDNRYAVSVINKGESYLYLDGKWTDLTEILKDAGNDSSFVFDNFSIKAFTLDSQTT